ncbi:hypothetical protein [Escherichia coli]|uniref:hypothetical protein n=1 Tax=Escherichia coli TaxID=562 RepID=UPI000F0B8340|nr:hypothetical protein [Escherichia coli]
MLPSETMIWQPEFTDKTLSRKPGAVQVSRLPKACDTAGVRADIRRVKSSIFFFIVFPEGDG